MKNISVLLIASVLISLMVACSQSSGKENSSTTNNTSFLTAGLEYNQAESEKLYEGKCMICHGVGTSEETAIAPPMASVKRRYLRDFSSKEDFVEAMVSFSENPTEEKAMMYNALDKFKVMPNLAYKKEELVKIALFMYDTDIVMPSWHENHEKGNGRKSGKNRNETKKTAETLLNNNCVICHQNSSSVSTALAPPISDFVNIYKEKYNTKKEFITAVQQFVENPHKDKALMPESVKQYNLMPKLNYAEEDVKLIAKYLFVTSSQNIEKQLAENKKNIIPEKLSPEGIYNAKCKICHNVDTEQGQMLAPPMVNIKRKYSKVFSNKEDFIKAVVNFSKEPELDNAIMFGALKQFDVMPKLNYNEEELKLAAEYIYNNEFDKPSWFK